jgi:ABC-type nitrate/sulfonate/bicarbonate transport system substrate-binding protein
MAVLCALALLASCDDSEPQASGDDAGGRATVTLAVFDDPSRHAALYALENALVTSDVVDLVPAYVSQSGLSDALSARQYDVIETASLAIPPAVEEGDDVVVLSAGRIDQAGTLLFVQAGGDVTDVSDLTGEELGLSSLEGMPALKSRYLLQEGHDMDVSADGGGLSFVEAPSQSLSGLLRSGDVSAAVLQDLSAYLASNDADFVALANVSEDVSTLPTPPLLDSVLITFGDIAREDDGTLQEVNRLLGESLAYFQANREAILDEVAVQQDVDPAYLRWWWERVSLPFGDVSPDVQQQLLDTWQAAEAIGELETYPDLEGLVFESQG